MILNKWRKNEETGHVNKAVIKAAVTLEVYSDISNGRHRWKSDTVGLEIKHIKTYTCGYSRYELIVRRTPHVSSSASPCICFHNAFEWSVAEQVNEFTDMHWHTL